MPEKCGKNEGENYFSPLWCLIQKLDPISGLHAKNQREISSNKVGRLLWPFGGKMRERRGNGKRKERNELSSPELSFPTQC